MRAILVILSALGAAFLVMGYVRSWQMRKAIKTGKSPEAIDNNYILGALVGLVVFAFGVWNQTARRRMRPILLPKLKMEQ